MTWSTAEVVAFTVAVVLAVIAFAVRPRHARPTSANPRNTAAIGPLRRTVDDIRSAHRHRKPIPAEDIADWCDQLARQMRSGSTLRDALTSTTPAGITLSQATDELRLRLERGQSIPSALTTTRQTKSPHLDLVSAVIAVAARLGGSSTTALERSASALRLLAADRQERVAQAAQARLSAHVLTVVPMAMLALLVLTDADVRATLLAPIGATCVAIGLVLNGVGWKWMRRIIGVHQ